MSATNMDEDSQILDELSQPRDLFEKTWVKVLLFLLIPGVIFILISAGIRVSQYGIDHTIVVMCQKKLVSGANGALRITLIDDNSGFFLPERVVAILKRGEKHYDLFDGEVMESGYTVARNFQIPEIKIGNATLEIHVYFDQQRRIIQQPVEIVSQYPQGALEYPSDTTPDMIVAKVKHGEHFLRVYTEGRGAPSGLSSLLFVQTTDSNGAPVAGAYEFELPVFQNKKKKEKKVEKVAGGTDLFGIDAFLIHPFDLHYPLTIVPLAAETDKLRNDTDAANAGMTELDTSSDNDTPVIDSDETDALQTTPVVAPKMLAPSVVYSGMKIDFKTPIVSAGDSIVAELRQISYGEPVYLDVFKGNQWVYATTSWIDNEGRAEISFEPPAKGVLRIQATNSPLQFSRNVAVRHVYVMDDKEDFTAVFHAIAETQKRSVHKKWFDAVDQQLDSITRPPNRNLLGAFALTTLYKGHSPLPLLVSSRKEDDAALNAFKEKFQAGLMIAILLLGAAVAVLIAVIAWQSAKRQQRLTQMIMAEDDPSVSEIDDASLGTSMVKSSRLAVSIQIGTLFLVVISAFFAIALLVVTLSWG